MSNIIGTHPLTGVTFQTAAITCANDYAIGGGSSVTTTQTFTCTASSTTPGVSVWLPAPATTNCQRALMCCAVFFVVIWLCFKTITHSFALHSGDMRALHV